MPSVSLRDSSTAESWDFWTAWARSWLNCKAGSWISVSYGLCVCSRAKKVRDFGKCFIWGFSIAALFLEFGISDPAWYLKCCFISIRGRTMPPMDSLSRAVKELFVFPRQDPNWLASQLSSHSSPSGISAKAGIATSTTARKHPRSHCVMVFTVESCRCSRETLFTQEIGMLEMARNSCEKWHDAFNIAPPEWLCGLTRIWFLPSMMYEKAHWVLVTWNTNISLRLWLRHCHASVAFSTPQHWSEDELLLLDLFQKPTCKGFAHVTVATKGKCNSLSVKKLPQNCEDSTDIWYMIAIYCRHFEAAKGLFSFFNLIPHSRIWFFTPSELRLKLVTHGAAPFSLAVCHRLTVGKSVCLRIDDFWSLWSGG